MGNRPQTSALKTTQKIAASFSTMSVIRVLVVAVVFAIAVSSVSGTKKQSSGGGGGWGQQQQGGWGQQSSGGGGFDIGGIFQKKIGKIGKLVSAKTGIIKKLLSPILAIKSKKAGLVGMLLAPKLKIFRQKFSKLGPERRMINLLLVSLVFLCEKVLTLMYSVKYIL